MQVTEQWLVHSITCLQYVGAELITGDVHGKIFIWNLEARRCLWDIQAHDGKVGTYDGATL